MELFSKKFKSYIEKVINNPEIILVATVPLKSTNPLVEGIKMHQSAVLTTVSN